MPVFRSHNFLLGLISNSDMYLHFPRVFNLRMYVYCKQTNDTFFGQ